MKGPNKSIKTEKTELKKAVHYKQTQVQLSKRFMNFLLQKEFYFVLSLKYWHPKSEVDLKVFENIKLN